MASQHKGRGWERAEQNSDSHVGTPVQPWATWYTRESTSVQGSMRTSIDKDLQAYIQDNVVSGISGNWFPGEWTTTVTLQLNKTHCFARRNHFQESSNPERKLRQKVIFGVTEKWMDKRQRQQVSGNKRKISPQKESYRTKQMFKTKEILVSVKVKRKEIT